jgi:hypothetical protein
MMKREEMVWHLIFFFMILIWNSASNIQHSGPFQPFFNLPDGIVAFEHACGVIELALEGDLLIAGVVMPHGG